MKLDSLKKLYIDQLKDLYSAENQLINALPTMVDAASAPELQEAFRSHLDETTQHVARLEEIFQGLSYSPRGEKCDGMEGLLKEGKKMASDEDGNPEVIDAGLIAAAQRVEHYEIAGYGTVHRYATMLGYDDAARILQQTLDEEYAADNKLDKIAEKINVEAMAEKA